MCFRQGQIRKSRQTRNAHAEGDRWEGAGSRALEEGAARGEAAGGGALESRTRPFTFGADAELRGICFAGSFLLKISTCERIMAPRSTFETGNPRSRFSVKQKYRS